MDEEHVSRLDFQVAESMAVERMAWIKEPLL